MLGGSAPSKYLAQLQSHAQVKLDDAAMDTLVKGHFIDPPLLRADSFQAFYSAPKAALLALVERAMGKASAEATAIPADDKEGDEEVGEAA
jgi:hypothetical protein